MDRRMFSRFSPLKYEFFARTLKPLICQFDMSQPITSKLAVVAQCMDSFVRAENDALTTFCVDQNRIIDLLRMSVLDLSNRLQRAAQRVHDLEVDLETSLDHNQQLVAYATQLEEHVLDCPYAPRLAPAAQRRLDFEMIDLTTEEEVEDSD